MDLKGKGLHYSSEGPAPHIAVTKTGLRYLSLLLKTAHAIRSILFASATITTF